MGSTAGFDLVVSNPPYIPSGDIAALQPEVASFEPRLALDGGPDGLDAYRRLGPATVRLLAPGGLAAFEIGIGTGAIRCAGSWRRPACGILRQRAIWRPSNGVSYSENPKRVNSLKPLQGCNPGLSKKLLESRAEPIRVSAGSRG